MLVLAYMIGWIMTLLSLPGIWVMVACSLVYHWVGPAEPARLALGWPALATLIGLALFGEFIETAAGATGAKRAGGSRRGMLLAIVGSIVGAIFGAGAGIPIPVIGSVLGSVLGAALGAFAGAALGEIWKGREFDHTWRVSEAAFWGRLFGTLAKLGVATLMCIVGIIALVI